MAVWIIFLMFDAFCVVATQEAGESRQLNIQTITSIFDSNDDLLNTEFVSPGAKDTYIGPYLPNQHCVASFAGTKPAIHITTETLLAVLQSNRPNITSPFNAGFISTPGYPFRY